jgi:hypothetical protein
MLILIQVLFPTIRLVHREQSLGGLGQYGINMIDLLGTWLLMSRGIGYRSKVSTSAAFCLDSAKHSLQHSLLLGFLWSLYHAHHRIPWSHITKRCQQHRLRYWRSDVGVGRNLPLYRRNRRIFARRCNLVAALSIRRLSLCVATRSTTTPSLSVTPNRRAIGRRSIMYDGYEANASPE